MEKLIALIAPVLQTVAIIVTAYFASRGLRAWREQLLGKRKMEVAEETLVATYKVRDALGYVRNAGAFGGEGQSRKQDPGEEESVAKLRDTYFVPLERIQGASDDFAQFQKARLFCEVYFEPDARKPFDAIMAARWKVVVAARMLISTAAEPKIDPQLRGQWQASIWAGAADTDPLADGVDAAVREIEALCRPHLRSGGG